MMFMRYYMCVIEKRVIVFYIRKSECLYHKNRLKFCLLGVTDINDQCLPSPHPKKKKDLLTTVDMLD